MVEGNKLIAKEIFAETWSRSVPDNESYNPLAIFKSYSFLITSGPYMSDTELDLTRFDVIVSEALRQEVDYLIMMGPFLPESHQSVKEGSVYYSGVAY